MAILNDGNVDSITNLTAGEDSKGTKLNFKQKEDGTYEADGSDGKRYAITISQGKVSVFDIPVKEGSKPTTGTASTAAPTPAAKK